VTNRAPTAPDPRASLADQDEEVEDDGVEADGDLLAAWWRSVAIANLAVGGVAVGTALLVLRDAWLAGGAGVLVGLAAFVRLRQQYYAFRRQHADRKE
jgi:hypothetical protein